MQNCVAGLFDEGNLLGTTLPKYPWPEVVLLLFLATTTTPNQRTPNSIQYTPYYNDGL